MKESPIAIAFGIIRTRCIAACGKNAWCSGAPLQPRLTLSRGMGRDGKQGEGYGAGCGAAGRGPRKGEGGAGKDPCRTKLEPGAMAPRWQRPSNGGLPCPCAWNHAICHEAPRTKLHGSARLGGKGEIQLEKSAAVSALFAVWYGVISSRPCHTRRAQPISPVFPAPPAPPAPPGHPRCNGPPGVSQGHRLPDALGCTPPGTLTGTTSCYF